MATRRPPPSTKIRADDEDWEGLAMCGIAGGVGLLPIEDLVGVARALASGLQHRGPDASGLIAGLPQAQDGWTPPPGVGTVTLSTDSVPFAFANRRLAILDLSAQGRQPMISADGRYAITYNGEVYNYLELRDTLERLGHRFRSRSDTEVVLHAYMEWGDQAAARLIGMFALAVYDGSRRQIWLARDPFGMKPLYWTAMGAGVAFASEISAFTALKNWRPRAEAQRVLDYLLDGRTDHPGGCMFDDIQVLPAGSHATISLVSAEMTQPIAYWRPPPVSEGGSVDLSFAEAAARLRDLFLTSVEWHLRSDVPVGTLLSGGIDSSSVVMAMREVGGSSLDIHTFSYIGEPGTIVEEPWIDIVNERARTVSRKLLVTPSAFQEDLPQLVKSLGEPFGSIAVYAQYCLFREAAKAGVPVILDGQGADELLAGYRSTWSSRLAMMLSGGHWVAAARFLRAIGATPQSGDPRRSGVLKRAMKMLVPDGIARPILRSRRRRRPWINPDWFEARDADFSEGYRVGQPGALYRELSSAVEAGLPSLLRYEDRNAMAHSVECRLPFLTTEFAEFVLRLPPEYLVAPDGLNKAVFREAMRGIVPDPVLARREKIGFSVPNDKWMIRTPLARAAVERAALLGPVNRAGLARGLLRVDAGMPPRWNDAMLLWRVAGLGWWSDAFDVDWNG